MEHQSTGKSMHMGTNEEMKIYTPRHTAKLRERTHVTAIPDAAPVRIYERPIRSDFVFLTEHHDLG